MKKLVFFFFAIVVSLAFIACQKQLPEDSISSIESTYQKELKHSNLKQSIRIAIAKRTADGFEFLLPKKNLLAGINAAYVDLSGLESEDFSTVEIFVEKTSRTYYLIGRTKNGLMLALQIFLETDILYTDDIQIANATSCEEDTCNECIITSQGNCACHDFGPPPGFGSECIAGIRIQTTIGQYFNN